MGNVKNVKLVNSRQIKRMGNVRKIEIEKYQEKNRKWNNVKYENLENFKSKNVRKIERMEIMEMCFKIGKCKEN